MAFLDPSQPRGAVLSDDRAYRYSLWRAREDHFSQRGLVAFIGLNPSTADETEDDPTIRRCLGFSQRWGHCGFVMLNLFAVRATCPKVMKRHPKPVGPVNDAAIRAVVCACERVVCCWGAHGSHLGRDNVVLNLLRGLTMALWCFGITKGGQPRHPLYLPKDCEIVEMK